MRVHAILPVRDEADIIEQSLAAMLRWADAVYIFDTGSEDDTWSIINEIALKEPRLVVLGRQAVYFSETRLRAWMFHQARRHMQDGDWFLRVDADEFHHVRPQDFIRERLKRHETIVYHQYYDFQLTESEVEAWAHLDKASERSRPIEERRRFYVPSVYSEPRLCRYRESMRWPPTVSFPFNAGLVAEERLPIRHYPCRDPDQLKRRCLLRAVMMSNDRNRRNWSRPELHHWSEREWRKFVVADDNAALRQWAPGQPLPALRNRNHLATGPKRLAQQVVHRFLVRGLDRFRPKWPPGTGPQAIEPEVVDRLRQELGAAAG